MLSASLDRRSLIRGAGLGMLSTLGGAFPGWAQAGTADAGSGPGVLSGEHIRIEGASGMNKEEVEKASRSASRSPTACTRIRRSTGMA